jgi:predicted nucleotidyltransferase
MTVAGIVAEYNPFHNGHKTQIEYIKSNLGVDYVVIVMSGNFTQRGTPAMMDKYARTEIALNSGADLVLELPLYYSVSSAEYFGSGAVALLDKLGVVNYLCFGSESGNIDIISDVAKILNTKSGQLDSLIKTKIKQGLSYPVARSQAIGEIIPNSYEHVDAMNYPNNILGIEYIKAINKRKSSMIPYTNKRVGSGYHARMVSNTLSSALAIRQSVESNKSIKMISELVPDYCYKYMDENYNKTFPVWSNDISSMLKYKLLLDAGKGYTEYVDVNKDLSDKIKKNLNKYVSFEQFCDLLKSKDVTYARVSRCLIHILLNIKKDNLKKFVANDYAMYARILGLKKEASPLLNAIKKESKIPLISKLADARNILDEDAMKMLESDIEAAHIYDTIITDKFEFATTSEFQRKIITI